MANADNDKDKAASPAAATAEPAAPRKAPGKRPPRPLPPWKVLLHNDEVNDQLHVVETIVMLTRLPKLVAVRRMFEAHESGLSLLLTTHRERAELYQQQFASRGLTVTIEKA